MSYALEAREPGARRKKLAGYLKAANELRQTYTQNYLQTSSTRDGSGDDPVPGAFPQATVGQTVDAELVIFPSYARRHIRRKSSQQSGTTDAGLSAAADRTERQEDDKAVVDVDVRGWVFTPQSGPMNRKQRLFIAMARQLVGLPAPTTNQSDSAPNSRSSSPTRLRDRVEAHHARHDDEIAAREAAEIMKRGEKEAKVAVEGGYSERPSRDLEGYEGDSDRLLSRESSPYRPPKRVGTDSEALSARERREAFKNTAQMTAEELSAANEHLLTRLKPFLANPSISIHISAFFYNEDHSRMKTVETDASGHFSLRAALEFVPTHVRVLVSDKLSATQEIMITEPQGVSIISDIDDTIKHSAITAGAREIFRNVFIRELGDLSVDGVKEWYQQLASKGVFMHYVSNSPWQIYPLLKNYFALAGLPQGSIHLKAYSGMFQGIFEPVAERKKGSLERIFSDFPDRRFILVGDSGEADLEVYTEVVQENPGRILGVFIRDVTTSTKKEGFNAEWGPLSWEKGRLHKSGSGLAIRTRQTQAQGPNRSNAQYSQDDDAALREAIRRSLNDTESDAKHNRPNLPPRRQDMASKEENLIDLNSSSSSDDEPPLPSTPPKGSQTPVTNATKKEEPPKATTKKPPPPRPAKPSQLSSSRDVRYGEVKSSEGKPTLPPRRTDPQESEEGAMMSSQNGGAGLDASYRSVARAKLVSAYNRLPSPAAYLYGTEDASTNTRSSNEPSALRSLYNEMPAMSTDSLSSTTNPPTSSYSRYYDGDPNPANRKEELWKRRWARAKEILDEKGVVLRAWRVGYDVVEDSMKLIDAAQKAKDKAANGRKTG